MTADWHNPLLHLVHDRVLQACHPSNCDSAIHATPSSLVLHLGLNAAESQVGTRTNTPPTTLLGRN